MRSDRKLTELIFPALLLALISSAFLNWSTTVRWFRLDEMPPALAGLLYYLFGVAAWLLLALLLRSLIQRLIWERLFEARLGATVPKIMKDLVHGLIWIGAIGGIVGYVFDQSLMVFLAAAGGAGFVIGLAIKNIISDLFSGIALNVERPFRIGDVVQLESGALGRVIEINWRMTKVMADDRIAVMIPNGILSAQMVRVHGGPTSPYRQEQRLRLDFTVPPERGRRILEAAVRSAQPPFEGCKPRVDIVELTEDGVVYRIWYWVNWDDWSTIRTAVLTSVLRQLSLAGIRPAYELQRIYHTPLDDSAQDEGQLRRTLIRSVQIFRSLAPDEIEVLAQRSARVLVEPGDTVVRRGDTGESMYVIAEGLLAVEIFIESQGREVQVATMTGGQFFGELSLLTGEPRTATIRALTQVLLYEIHMRDLMELIRDRGEIAEQITEIVAGYKLRDAAKQRELTAHEQETEHRTFANQLLTKLRSFFAMSS